MRTRFVAFLFLTCVLLAPLSPLSPAAVASAAPATREVPMLVLAQQNPSQSSSSNRVNGRQVKSMVKLGVLAVGGVVVLGGAILNKLRRKN